jgi:hypothetical protein
MLSPLKHCDSNLRCALLRSTLCIPALHAPYPPSLVFPSTVTPSSIHLSDLAGVYELAGTNRGLTVDRMAEILTESGLDPANNAVKAALAAATQQDGTICVDLGDKDSLLTKVQCAACTATARLGFNAVCSISDARESSRCA